MKRHKKIILSIILIIIFSILTASLCKNKCYEIPQTDPEKPMAVFTVMYTNKDGNTVTNDYPVKNESGPKIHSAILPYGIEFSVRLRVTDRGGIKYFKTKWEHLYDDEYMHDEEWQIKDITECSKISISRNILTGIDGSFSSKKENTFTFHIYGEDMHQNNTGTCTLIIKYDKTLKAGFDTKYADKCKSSGTVLRSLEWNNNLTPKWKGIIAESSIYKYCNDSRITRIQLPAKINADGISPMVLMIDWNIQIGEKIYTDFIYDEEYATIELDLPVNNYELLAWSPNYIPEYSHSGTINGWKKYIDIRFSIE